MNEQDKKALDAIFKPASVAFIGASQNVNKWGGGALSRTLKGGYLGLCYPVNPKGGRIQGLQAYADIRDIPAPVDLAVFTVPARMVPQAVAAAVEKGVKGGVVISADFAETGEHGRALETEMVRLARAGGMRLVGPNGMGVWSSAVSLNIALFTMPQPGELAFVSQSGTFGGALASIAREQGFGLSKFISMGNQADLTAADYLDYLAEDEDTKVIALYLEGVKEGPRFIETARRVSRIKPILVYKGGSSVAGARATASHTASLAGSDEIFSAVCRQAAMMRVAEVEHLFVMAEALLYQPLPRGRRVAVLGSGGQGVATVDAMSALGLEVPELDTDAAARLRRHLPPHAPTPRNPVDYAASARSALDEARLVEELLKLDYIDAVITNVPANQTGAASYADSMRLGVDGAELFTSLPEKYGKPVLTQRWRGWGESMIFDFLKRARIPIYNNPEDAARGMWALCEYARIRNRK